MRLSRKTARLGELSPKDLRDAQVHNQGLLQERSAGYAWFGQFTLHPDCRFNRVQQRNEQVVRRSGGYVCAEAVIELVGFGPYPADERESPRQPRVETKSGGVLGGGAGPIGFVSQPFA